MGDIDVLGDFRKRFNYNTLYAGLSREEFINFIDNEATTKGKSIKDIFSTFIAQLNKEGKEIYKMSKDVYNFDAGQLADGADKSAFEIYYTQDSHSAIQTYFIKDTVQQLFKEVFDIREKITKIDEAKEEEEKRKGNLWNSVLPQPDFTEENNNKKIEEEITKILQGQETPKTLRDKAKNSIIIEGDDKTDDIKNKEKEDKLKEYTLFNDEQTDFNTANKVIEIFVEQCINNPNSDECSKHIGNMFDTNYTLLIDYFESQIKQLPRDKLLRIAKGLDIRVYPPTGLFETEKLWEKHTNFLNINFKGTDKQVLGILRDVFTSYKVDNRDDTVGSDKIKELQKDKNDFEHVINKKHERVTTVKGYLLEFVKVLSHELNEKKFETEEKDEKDRPNSRFNKDVVQYRILNNSRLYPTNPYSSYFIWGGKFEFKPNKNQTADILEKMIKALLESLRAHNKYLNTEDIQLIYAAIDKLRKFETYLGELLVEASNYAENIQKEKDMTQQYITIDKMKENNKKINETTSKITTLKQKIDYLINTLYTREKEEENKTKQSNNKEEGITINY